MMSQRGALSSLFANDPFFSQERLLWPLHGGALSSLQQDFFHRRGKLADSLLRELHDGHPLLRLPLFSSTRLSDEKEKEQQHQQQQQQQRETPSTELLQAPQAPANNGDLLVTLDARGYAPSDITVKLEGRRLAVMAIKQDGAEESQTSSSSSTRAALRASASSQVGFVQMIDLPAHVDLSGLSCSLMDDGQLRIHAPVAQQSISEENQGPVRFRSSLEFPVTKNKMEEEHKD